MKCIEDEIPFDLPDGWAWERIGNVSTIARGGSPRPIEDFLTDDADGINWIKIGDTEKDGKYILHTKEKIKPVGLSKTRYVRSGDFLLTNSMSFGRPYILKTDGCIHDGWLVIGNIDTVFNQDYLYYALSSGFMYTTLSLLAAGSTVKNLKSDTVRSVLFPIPPLGEQERMARRIEQLITFVDDINANKNQLIDIINQTKAKILDLAIRGQLVPQDPADEPASVLLERIRAEKEELIRKGKIKRDKKESIIFRGEDNSYYLNDGQMTADISDDLPFDIPDSWRWARLKDILIINPRNKLDDTLEVAFIPMPLIDDGYSGKHSAKVRPWKEVKTGFTHFAEGDVGVAKITPCFENRKSTVFENLSNGYGAGTTELHILRPYGKTILAKYLLAYVKSDYFVENGKQAFTGAVGQQRIGKEYVEGAYFPIPPIKEQERIVQQINTAFECLNTITDALS
ncbi:type I restriction endonuclease subunit S [Oscillospiraceae bacterium]|nr:type I restriction endonuclease subunit S [Oscillospiraceae bacterium]